MKNILNVTSSPHIKHPDTTSGIMLDVIIALLPGCICGLLVFPIPNYHNVLCALISIYKFYTERRNYVWKGWCFHERFGESSKSRKW